MFKTSKLLKSVICSAFILGSGLYLLNNSHSVEADGIKLELAHGGNIVHLSEFERFQEEFDGVAFYLHIIQNNDFFVNESDILLYKITPQGHIIFFVLDANGQPVKINDIHNHDTPLGATHLFCVSFGQIRESHGYLPKTNIKIPGSINLFDTNPVTVAQMPIATQLQHGHVVNNHFRFRINEIVDGKRLLVVTPSSDHYSFDQQDAINLAKMLDRFNGYSSDTISSWAMESARLAGETIRRNQAVIYFGVLYNLHYAGNVETFQGNVNMTALQQLFIDLLTGVPPAPQAAIPAPQAAQPVTASYTLQQEDTQINQYRVTRKLIFRPVTGVITPEDINKIAKELDEANAYTRVLGNENSH